VSADFVADDETEFRGELCELIFSLRISLPAFLPGFSSNARRDS
jgi:hypothetical protein